MYGDCRRARMTCGADREECWIGRRTDCVDPRYGRSAALVGDDGAVRYLAAELLGETALLVLTNHDEHAPRSQLHTIRQSDS